MDQMLDVSRDRIDTPQTLQIKMFGEFSISNDYFSLSTTKKAA